MAFPLKTERTCPAKIVILCLPESGWPTRRSYVISNHSIYTRLLAILGVLWCIQSTYAQTAPIAIDWKTLADSTLAKAIKDQEVLGATVVIVSGDETLYMSGFGVSRMETQNAVTDTTLFQVGSIGKVLTTIAVFQQVERGRLDLSEDINTYLDGWQIVVPGDTPLTLHHLLTHSGGLNERAIGYAARRPDEVEPLGAHLAANFPPSFAEPDRYISYSNYGFGLAGYAVERVTDTPFTAYVTAEILAPLGIQASGYNPSSRADLAIGYRKRGEDFVAAPVIYRPVTPAGSFVANAQDMGNLLRALLNDGTPVLSPTSVEQMTEVHKTMHPALMGNGYGFEESRWGDIKGFGKGGSIPGFMAYMALLPEQDLGLFVAVNGGSDAPIDRFVMAAMGQLSEGPWPDALPSHLLDVSQFVGEYRSNRYDRTSLEKLLNFDVRNIYTTGEGDLRIWHEGMENVYRPVASRLFQHAEMPNRMLYFEADNEGNTTHAYFNDRIAGGYVPVIWEKNGFWGSNGYINEYFGIVLIVGLSYLLLPIVIAIRWLARRKRADNRPRRGILRWMNGVGFSTSALLLAYVLYYFIPLMASRPDLFFGLPSALSPWDILPIFIIAGFGIFAGLWTVNTFRAKTGWVGTCVTFTFLISGVLLGEFFLRWNLI